MRVTHDGGVELTFDNIVNDSSLYSSDVLNRIESNKSIRFGRSNRNMLFWIGMLLCVRYGFVSYLVEYGFTFTFASKNSRQTAYSALYLTALIGLVTLTFWPLIGSWATHTVGFHPAYQGFLGLSILECMWQTDTAHHFIMPIPMEVGGITIRLILRTMFMVLSLRQTHCKSSTSSSDEFRRAPSGCQPSDKAI